MAESTAVRRKLYAICDECQVTVLVDGTHLPKGQDIPPVEEWDSFFPLCPICGNSIGPADEDPSSLDEDIDWHRRAAGRNVVQSLMNLPVTADRDQLLHKLAVYYDLELPQTTGS